MSSKRKTDDLQDIRARIASLKAELSAVENAPRSIAERRADVHAWCARQAAEVDRAVAYRVRAADFDGLLTARPGPSGAVPLGPVLAALLGVDVLAEALCKHLADEPDGPSEAERAQRVAEIDRALLAAEIAEEQAIQAAEDRGEYVQRRPDADPRAVLGERPE